MEKLDRIRRDNSIQISQIYEKIADEACDLELFELGAKYYKKMLE